MHHGVKKGREILGSSSAQLWRLEGWPQRLPLLRSGKSRAGERWGNQTVGMARNTIKKGRSQRALGAILLDVLAKRHGLAIGKLVQQCVHVIYGCIGVGGWDPVGAGKGAHLLVWVYG